MSRPIWTWSEFCAATIEEEKVPAATRSMTTHWQIRGIHFPRHTLCSPNSTPLGPESSGLNAWNFMILREKRGRVGAPHQPALSRMPGLQGIVADVSERRYANMSDRHPALECVVSGAMEDIGDPDRGHRSRRLQRGKSCRVVHHRVGEKNLLPPASLEIARRGIVRSSSHRNA